VCELISRPGRDWGRREDPTAAVGPAGLKLESPALTVRFGDAALHLRNFRLEYRLAPVLSLGFTPEQEARRRAAMEIVREHR
jgi:hypothetical protein